jgi:hypothetical protein
MSPSGSRKCPPLGGGHLGGITPKGWKYCRIKWRYWFKPRRGWHFFGCPDDECRDANTLPAVVYAGCTSFHFTSPYPDSYRDPLQWR